ncbi:rhomboid family intramembrane serine protease [Botrimarina mediterranea]|uniref:Rhomboid family protein n=1 Tax=Botrimarina mediterranea TaxID=2528022 RepID=A0A518KDI4_9BACT|nr:rhomboid family intramembrane serine protease [Botrimarina mediterranea]QDV75847.1 Rhomboid family protein [Botrimarina mediterranea]
MLFPLYDRNPHARLPIVTIALIVANVFCFWVSVQNGPEGFVRAVYERGFVPQRLTRLDDPAPVISQNQMPGNQVLVVQLSTKAEEVYPTLLTMMFMHGGILHLLSNMWMLWVFGDNVEDRLGRFVYPFFYIVGGLLGTLAQWAIDPMSTQPVIGASGAVAAVLGAYAITFPTAKVRTLIFIGIPLLFDLPALVVLGGWFLIQMLMGVEGLGAPADVNASVAFWAHIGGFVAGLVLMPLLTIGAHPPDKDWRTESREMFDF